MKNKKLEELKKKLYYLGPKLTKANRAQLKIKDKYDGIKEEHDMILNMKLVGNCYKVEDRYSTDGSWWLYRKILGVETNTFLTEIFSEDCYGAIEVKKDKIPAHYDTFERSTQIPLKEYNAAKNKILRKMGLKEA